MVRRLLESTEFLWLPNEDYLSPTSFSSDLHSAVRVREELIDWFHTTVDVS